MELTSSRKFTGVILAGGKSSRMGSDKGLLKIKGVEIIKMIINQIKPHFDELLIVSDNINYAQFGIEVVNDIFKDKGPLSGIYTGLRASNNSDTIFFSCDNPKPTHKMIEKLKESGGESPVVFIYEEKIQPFPGYYLKESSDHIKERIERNELSVIDFIKGLNAKLLNWSETNKNNKPVNINTPEELHEYERN